MESFQRFWKRTALEKQEELARAVCEATLEEEGVDKDSSEYEEKMQEYMRKLGIMGAGPVPNSLLARQDLEGDVHKSLASEHPCKRCDGDGLMMSDGKWVKCNMCGGTGVDSRYAKGNRAQSAEQSWPLNADDNKSMVDDTQGKKDETAKSAAVCFACNTAFDLPADRYACPNCGSDSIRKGEVEETKKDLIEMAEDAKDTAKTDLAANIKAVQLNRQKATIQARMREGDAVGKSFKASWAAMRQINKK